MFILTDNPEPNVLKRIFDTDTGIYYELVKAWPNGMTRPEADDAGKTYDVVVVHSVHRQGRDATGPRFDRQAAEKLWAALITKVEVSA